MSLHLVGGKGRGWLLFLLLAGQSQMGLAQIASPIERMLSAEEIARMQSGAPELAYDSVAKTFYTAYSSEHSLFIHIEIIDAAQQRKVIQNGLDLWIDAKGKKNKKTGIQYPVASTERVLMPVKKDGSVDARKGLETMLEGKKDMVVTGFASSVNGTRPAAADTGLRVVLHFKNDTLVYDAEVPFYVFARPLAAHTSLSIGIIEKGLLPSGMGGEGMPGDGGGPGGGGPGEGGPGGGGFGGGPDGGGPPPGGMPDMEEMQKAFRDDGIWFRFAIG